MQKLVILGAGGLGCGAMEIAEAMNQVEPTWEILGFLDDNADLHGSRVLDYSVIGGKQWLTNNPDTSVCIALGAPGQRKQVADWLSVQAISNFATLIHPSAIISPRSSLGEGCIAFPGVVIDTQTKTGHHVVLNKSCCIGHDVTIGNFVNISPTATLTGNDVIHEGCMIGANACVIPQKEIGSWSNIGAGSVVSKDIPAGVTAVGIPAKIIKGPASA